MLPRSPIIIDIEASGFGSGSDPIRIDVARDDGRTVFAVAGKPSELLCRRTACNDGWVMGGTWFDQLHAAALMRGEFTFSTQEIIRLESQTTAGADARQALLAGEPETRHRASHDVQVVRGTFGRMMEAGNEGSTADNRDTPYGL